MKKIKSMALAAVLGASFQSQAGMITDVGFFDDASSRLHITFDVSQLSNVLIATAGYAGGSAGAASVPDGGFDPYLWLFDSAGNLIASDDDGSNVVSASSGSSYDSVISEELAVGSYEVVMTMFGNSWENSNWSDNANLNDRTLQYGILAQGAYADNFSISMQPTDVSEPAPLLLMLSSLFGLGVIRRTSKNSK